MDDDWGRDEWDWDDWPNPLDLDDTPIEERPAVPRVLTGVFEDGPKVRPTLMIAEGCAWPDRHVWIARNNAGYVTEFRYQHQGGGLYRVAHEQVLAPGRSLVQDDP